MKSSFVKSFLLNIILPTVLTIMLFVVAMFFIIIPASEKHLLDRKREMIRELTNTAWTLLESYHARVKAGELGLNEAKEKAAASVRSLRYGDENKDYFWITDMQPRMIVHPYRSDLEGQDLSDFVDSHGKKLFVEFVQVVHKQGSGYVDYMWQWKDDSSRVVPKLSYVRGFDPWNWIVGTGIYIEDVRAEISRITKRLINTSLAISIILALILFYIARQTYNIEKEKAQAEKELAESREKYKTLVEASTEGALMILDSRIIFANQIIQEMLGFSEEEFTRMDINQLFKEDTFEDMNHSRFTDFLDREEMPAQFETDLRQKAGQSVEVLVSVSQIHIFNRTGFIVITRDMRSIKQIREELGESRQKFQMLTDNINIGVFRILLEKPPHFVQLNDAAKKILGLTEQNHDHLNITDFFRDKEEAELFSHSLMNEGSVNKRIIQLKRRDGGNSIVSVSAVISGGEEKHKRTIDGIIEDVSERKRSEQAREEIISELQTSLVYLNQPVKHFAQKCLRLSFNTTIKDAVHQLERQNQNAALVVAASNESIGIVTADDLWKRVVLDGRDLAHPIYEIMTAPLVTLSENALVFEALLLMQERLIRHLPLVDGDGKINNLISDKEIIQLFQYSAGLLVQEINRAESVEELIDRSKTLPQLVKYLVESGSHAANVTRIISSVADSVADKLLRFALAEMDEPPVPFAFMILGSQGREEQTLKTDQDNVLVYQDTEQDVQGYFLELAQKVNGWLDQAGYTFCNGEVMAKNPKWCVSLSRWKGHFAHWIKEAEPQDLVEISIFFDFRFIYGEDSLVDELRRYVNDISRDKPAFFNHLAKNSLLIKPPVTITGGIKRSSGEDHEAFDVKLALLPIVDFARIYSLRHHIPERNTIQRLNKLYESNIITRQSRDEMAECYNYLMMLRFRHQVGDVGKNKKPDNFINPETLTLIERHTLKKIFSQVSNFQKKLSYDFTGIA